MTERTRTAVAGGIAAIVLTLSLGVLLFGSYDSGIRLSVRDGGLVVGEIVRFSQADRDGVQPGMLVVAIDDNQLIRLPQYSYPESKGEPDPADPQASSVPAPSAVPAPTPFLAGGPIRPTPVDLSDDGLARLAAGHFDRLTLATPSDLDLYSPDFCCFLEVNYPGVFAFSQASTALLPGLALLLLGTWWLGGGRASESLRPLAIPAAAATATPLLVQPMLATGTSGWIVVAGILTVAAMIPLAVGLAEMVEDERDRVLVTIGIAIVAVVGLVTGIFLVTGGLFDSRVSDLRWATVGAIALLPGLAAAGPVDLAGLRVSGITSGRLLQSTELAVVGATPLFALGTNEAPYLWPIGFWLIAILVAARFTVRPLARLVTRAQLQRDLIVAATEAERARLAADIHDEALQELTLLVRRLETSGDTEGAELGRTVADRLRAICGDLRLPILDDLGVGPALDWLVLRIEKLAGGEVRLERTDGTRPPPDVELAIFRVAQEALANAVKHGQPPIVVRYRATDSGVSLSIDDAGPGIAADAGSAAEQGGHFGLLNMQQRAEQIGAILDIRRWPGGGTHVALEWRHR
jgi:signal transduction histidine kinase